MTFSFIVGPLVGGVIGYITNGVAIKMLFRPYKAKYVFGLHVPLTPGIIPKEKPRIAESIAEVVSDNLMSPQVLQQSLLSDETVSKVASAYDRLALSLQQSPDTLEQFLLKFLSPEQLLDLKQRAVADLSTAVESKLCNAAIGPQVAHLVVQQVIGNMQQSGLFGKMGAGVLSLMQQSTEDFLAKNINELLEHNAPQMVGSLLEGEVRDLLGQPMNKLLEGRQQQFFELRKSVVHGYQQLIGSNLNKILSAVDIKKIVRDRINALDMAETEKLIYDIMRKELRAIMWLGALLGFMMGFITSII